MIEQKNLEEKQYLDILQNILDNGVKEIDRTGVGTLSTFGEKMVFDLSKGKYPLLTTKKTFLKGIIIELIWLIRGETNIKYLVDRDVHIWTEWPFVKYLSENKLDNDFPRYSEKWKEKMKWFENEIKSDINFAKTWGDLGPVYGSQWRNYNGEGVDQLTDVIDSILNTPTSRRQLVIAYNPARIREMLLPPCHLLFQFNVNTEKKELDLQMYQRSADYPLGIPFNIASYSLLLILISKITGLKPGKFIHITGNSHIYLNQIDGIKEQLQRIAYDFPEIKIKKEIKTLEDIENLEFEDFELINYNCHPMIKMPIAV